ncbi:hypothetical protein Aeqsu_1319 [Aequorivita sublithincola DSM 14238]|uniref:Uncharacterized protein n=1 Tax=Aequorivita sublithincola (strain DSM 14238 / LMG 21431 / ACAM 643 / 9-3) TaxID=746697 RepID=I3YUZ4_AEQSU|nr:hypothetical protein [Aequorivita sublithincola]AFL80812.1 hypothetical protein Aeqsu_1319 [Aequorivita sublithincola DSM 14238]
MELSAPIIGLIILLLIAVPVAYMIINASGTDKKVRKSVSQLSQSNGINLKTIDIIGNCVIGVDEASKKLIYTSKKNPSGDFKVINMEDVKDCRAKSIKQSDKTLDWVGLEIVERTGKFEIPFYNEHDEDELSTDAFVCLQDAKRWESTLRPLLKAS